MSSLAECLNLTGKNITQDDKIHVKSLAKEYAEEGYKPVLKDGEYKDMAGIAAVNDVLADLRAELKHIEGEIEEQIKYRKAIKKEGLERKLQEEIEKPEKEVAKPEKVVKVVEGAEEERGAIYYGKTARGKIRGAGELSEAGDVIEPNRYSKEIQIRMDEATDEHPFIPEVNTYAVEALRREIQIASKKPHFIKLKENQIYDGTADKDKLWKKATEIFNKVVETTPKPINHRRTIFANLVGEAGWEGYALEASNGEKWAFLFGEIEAESPIAVKAGISPVTQGVMDLPTKLAGVRELGKTKIGEFEKYIDEVNKRYQEVKFQDRNITYARFKDVTFDEQEYGLTGNITGPVSSIRAFLSELALGRKQGFMFFTQSAPEASSTGVNFKFAFKEGVTPDEIEAALDKHEIYNRSLTEIGERIYFDTYIEETAEYDKAEKLFNDIGQPGTSKFDHVVSETIGNKNMNEARQDFKGHLINYHGKTNGRKIYGRARSEGYRHHRRSELDRRRSEADKKAGRREGPGIGKPSVAIPEPARAPSAVKEIPGAEVAGKLPPGIEISTAAKKPEVGLAFIRKMNKVKPFLSYREIKRGRNKGKIEVSLTDGKKAIINIDSVKRWPGKKEVPETKFAKAPAGYRMSAREFARAKANLVAFTHWLKRAGISKSLLDRITLEMKPIISLKGKDYEKTLEDHGGRVDVILGASTIGRLRALIEISSMQSQADMEKTAYHEAFHVAMKWLLPEADANKVLAHYKGNEEKTAEAFADFMWNREKFDLAHPPTLIRRLFLKLRRILQQIRNGMRLRGFNRPEDFFANIYLGVYRPHLAQAERTAIRLPSAIPVPEEIAPASWRDVESNLFKEPSAFAVKEGISAMNLESQTVIADAVAGDLVPSIEDILAEAKGKTWGKFISRFGPLYKKEDMGVLSRTFTLPYWAAKKYPNIKKLVAKEVGASEVRQKDLFRDYNETGLGDLQSEIGKSKVMRKAFEKLLWKWEGQRFPEKSVPTEWHKPITKGQDIEINPKHYNEIRTYLEAKETPPLVIDGFITIRKLLDEKFVDIDRAMRIDKVEPGLIEEYRASMGKIHNYFPHRRTGDSYIQIIDTKEKDPDKKVVYRRHFWNKQQRMAKALTGKTPVIEETDKWLAEALKSGGLTGTRSQYAIQKPKKVEELPDEVFFQVPVESMQQIAAVAGRRMEKSRVKREAERLVRTQGLTMDKALEKAEAILRADLEVAISKAFADVFKARGWARHGIRRKGVPGHETEDTFGILFDYLSGYVGFKTKIDRARHHSKVLSEMDAKKNPGEYQYCTTYVKDVLANQDKADRTVDTLRGLFFVKYLGFVAKSAMINLTQNVVAGAPVLSIYVKGGPLRAERVLGKAMADTRRAMTSKAAWIGKEVVYPGLNEIEQKALHDMIEGGTTTDQYLRELMGDMPGQGWTKYMKKGLDKAGILMQIAERFNRASMGLASFRTAYNQPDIKLEDGTATKGNYEASLAWAKERVYDSHFLYGKMNYPGIVRGKTLKYLRPAYTFRTFTHNYLLMMQNMIANQGWAGKKAAARGLRNLFFMGGLTSIPFFKALTDVLDFAMGDDDEDILTKSRMAMPREWMKDLVVYGLPGVAGVDLTGSLSIEVPRSWADIFGVPYAIFDDTINMTKSIKAGLPLRAISEMPITPISVRNALRGIELLTTGQMTRSGKNINYYGQAGPKKIAIPEAIAKSLIGLQPVSVSKGYAAHKAITKMEGELERRKFNWANKFVNSLRRNDRSGMEKIMREIVEWNEKAISDGKPHRVVNLMQSIKYRLRSNVGTVPKILRGRALRISEEWK